VISAMVVVLLIVLIIMIKSAGSSPAVVNNIPDVTAAPDIDDGPKPLYDEPEYFTISCIGDNTLWSSVQFEQSNAGLPKTVNEDYSYPFKNTVEYFLNDELTLANAENTFSDKKLSSVEMFYFCAPTSYVRILTDNGVDFVTTANNHMMDFGDKGAEATYAALEEAGLAFGKELEANIITSKSGLKIGIYTAGIDSKPYAHQDEIVAAVQKLREDGAEYVICMFHWGKELYYTPDDTTQIQLAHACIDAGADLVYGSHPHCLQPIEQYGNGLILYSLGNWCFGGNTAPTDCDTAIVQVTVERDIYGKLSTKGCEAIPCCVSSKIDAAQKHRDNYNDYCPTPYEEASDAYKRVMDKLHGTYEAAKQGADYSNFYASWG